MDQILEYWYVTLLSILILLVIIFIFIRILIRVHRSLYDYSNFVNFTSGVQSLVVSIAILTGGTWGIIKYIQLKQAEIAEIQLKLEEKKYELISLDLSIDSHVKTFKDTKNQKISEDENRSWGIFIEVKVKNNGAKDILLDIGDSPVIVSKIEIMGQNQYAKESFSASLYEIEIVKEGVFKHIKVPVKIVQANSTKILSFYVEVENAGLYLLQFAIPSEKLSWEGMSIYSKRNNLTDKGETLIEERWNVNKYIYIE